MVFPTEVYSIDEAFADLAPLSIDDLTEYGKTMRERVLQYTGLPVSVGIASTKCLCKIANEIVKHDPSYEGVLDLTVLPDEQVDTFLSHVAIEDVWGIGRKYAGFLQNHGIMTARDLKAEAVAYYVARAAEKLRSQDSKQHS